MTTIQDERTELTLRAAGGLYAVPDIETVVEIDDALYDAKCLIEAMSLLLEAEDDGADIAARNIARIALGKIADAHKRMDAPRNKAATTEPRHDIQT
jgi:hypothetical protein